MKNKTIEEKQTRISEMRAEQARFLAYRVFSDNGAEWHIVFVLKNGRIREVYTEEAGAPAVGDIYLGRVIRNVKNIASSFVETEGGRFFLAGNHPQDTLLPVMVETLAYREKLARAVTELSVGGRYLVLTVEKNGTAFSGKLDAEVRKRLQEFMESEEVRHLLPEAGIRILFRTAAGDADRNGLLDELSGLLAILERIHQRTLTEKRCKKLYAASSVIQKTLAMAREEEGVWITASPELYEQALQETAQRKWSDGNVQLYQDTDISMATLYGLQKKLKQILSERVWLESGAEIVITETEAMCVIDVNSARIQKGKAREDVFLQLNLEAAREIAQQIVARNISGTILIDFISMSSKESETILISEMRALTKGLYPPIQVIDITKLGIMEITRQRFQGSIQEKKALLNSTILL